MTNQELDRIIKRFPKETALDSSGNKTIMIATYKLNFKYTLKDGVIVSHQMISIEQGGEARVISHYQKQWLEQLFILTCQYLPELDSLPIPMDSVWPCGGGAS